MDADAMRMMEIRDMYQRLQESHALLRAQLEFIKWCLVFTGVICSLALIFCAILTTSARRILRKSRAILELAAAHGKATDDKVEDLKTGQERSVQRVAGIMDTKAKEIQATIIPAVADEVRRAAGSSGDGLSTVTPFRPLRGQP